MEYIDRKQEIKRKQNLQREQEHWEEVHNNLIEVQQARVQKKSLEISNPGDADEKEADEVARRVSNGESAEVHGTGSTINRKGEGTSETTPEFQTKLESSKGGGQSLDDSTRSEMESKMGADFSGVKVHSGSEAQHMSENINAKAFTHGSDIYFNQGQYNPETDHGKELLAHELVHTVQQKGNVQRKIQRSLKIELQTHNYIWMISKDKKTVKTAPRKMDLEGNSQDFNDKNQKVTNTPAYLATGKYGGPALNEGDTVFVEVEDPLVMKPVKSTPQGKVQASDVEVMQPGKPAQFQEIWAVTKDENGNSSYEGEAVKVKQAGATVDLSLTSTLSEYNDGQTEIKYYWSTDLDSENKPKPGVTALDTHMDVHGDLVKGTLGILKERIPQFTRVYKILNTAVVSKDDVVGQAVTAFNLQLISDVDHSRMPNLKGQYYPSTFQFIYKNSTGETLPVHLDEENIFRDGEVKLMKVGKKTKTAGEELKQAEKVEIYKVTIDKSGTVDYFGQMANVELTDAKTNSTDDSNTVAGTVERKYYLSTQYKTDTELVKEPNRLDVHRDLNGSFKKDHVKFMKETKVTKLMVREQTAMELQSETGGFIEFETPKWFRRWSDLKMRIKDAVEMTKQIDASDQVTDETILGQIRGKIGTQAAMNEKIEFNKGTTGKKKAMTTLLEKGEREGGKEMGTIVKWPFGTEVPGYDMYVEIVDDDWLATVQISEGIRLSQFEELLKENETATVAETKTGGMSDAVIKVANAVLDDAVKKYSPEMERRSLHNLKGFLEAIIYYIIKGRSTDLSGEASKFVYRLMARTDFASMCFYGLRKDERDLFRKMVTDPTDPLLKNETLQTVITGMRTAVHKSLIEKANNAPEKEKAQINKRVDAFATTEPLDRTSTLFWESVGSEHSSVKTKGPVIYQWLLKMQPVANPEKPGTEMQGTDLLVGMAGISGAQSHRKVETDKVDKDYHLSEFEIRGTILEGKGEIFRDKWLSYAEERFKAAWARSADSADDFATKDAIETSKTGLIYDP